MDKSIFITVLTFIVNTHKAIGETDIVMTSTAIVDSSNMAVGRFLTSDPTWRGQFLTTGQPVVGSRKRGNNTRRKHSSRKIKSQLEHDLENLKETESECLNWRPTLNVTKIKENSSLIVDYCMSDGTLVMPSTHVCVSNVSLNMCVTVVKPACYHLFDDFSTDNFKLEIKASCNCFNRVYYNSECDTPVFEYQVKTESKALNYEDLSAPAPGEPPAKNVDVVLIIVGCGGVFIVGLSIMVIMAIKYKKRSGLFSSMREDTTCKIPFTDSDTIKIEDPSPPRDSVQHDDYTMAAYFRDTRVLSCPPVPMSLPNVTIPIPYHLLKNTFPSEGLTLEDMQQNLDATTDVQDDRDMTDLS